MPKDKDKDGITPLNNINTLRDLSNSIRKLSDDIYSSTYYTPTNGEYNLDDLRDGFDKSLNKLFQRNVNISGRPNISNVYTRIVRQQGKNVSSKDFSDFEAVFDDKQLIDEVALNYYTNSWIKQLDDEIDLICKYMPKLEEAIEIKKDMVLCADQFNRDFLTIRNKSSIDDSDFFNSEIDIIKDKYNLAELFDTMSYRAWKYGEDFLYIVPYKKAFENIFNKRKASIDTAPDQPFSPVVSESVNITGKDIFDKDTPKEVNVDDFNVQVNFNVDNALTESIYNIAQASEQLRKVSYLSLNEPAIIKEAEGLSFTTKDVKLYKDRIIPDNVVPGEDDDDFFKSKKKGENLLDDGFSDVKRDSEDNVEILKIPGCLVKRLDRHKVIPIYIEDMCMGYYYIEVSETQTARGSENMFSQNTLGVLQTNQQRSFGMAAETPKVEPFKNNGALDQFVSKLATMINKKFINNNQDLYRELYMILKHDEQFMSGNANNINVTFIPPEDIEHIYFKMDPKTHRGISTLYRALVPAKIFIAIMMSNAVGILTRSQDKRVYYVRQQVETNISKTLLSAINQIKQGNFGARNLENLMGILNITGQFNDYFIPKSASGESPIDFEILEGQKIDPNMEFLEKLEGYAINTTDIPAELIDSRMGVEFATQLTMTNTKHMRLAYKDQSKVQGFGSHIVTKIYNAEFNKTAQLALFLPPPLYISLTNTTQLFTNVQDIGQKIMEPLVKKLGGDDEAVSQSVMEYVRRTLGSYIDFEMMDDIAKRTILETAKKKSGEDQE